VNYKVGDTVVCIDAMPVNAPNELPTGLVRGQLYTIAAINVCCVSRVGLVEADSLGRRCARCKASIDGSYYSWRFIKLDGLPVEHEEETTANA